MACRSNSELFSDQEEFIQLQNILKTTFQHLHLKLDERESVLSDKLATIYRTCFESDKKKRCIIERMKLACDTFLSSILETNLLTTSNVTLKPIQDQIQELEANSQKVTFEYSPESIEIAIGEVGDFLVADENTCKEYNTQQEVGESEVRTVISDVVTSKLSSSEKMQTPIPGLCGTLNVDNFSYINSILQCLIHTPSISECFMKLLLAENSNGKHVEFFKSIFDQIYSGAHTCIEINRDILYQFALLSPSTDAYTYLTSLVTCLHREMNTVVTLDIDMHQSSSHDNEVSQLAWNLHSLCNQSIISDTIHGQYKSITTCQGCGSETFSFEILTSLSLPLSYIELPTGDDARNIIFTLILIDHFSKPITSKVQVNKNAQISQLCLATSFISGVDADRLVVCDVYSHRFHKIFDHNEPVNGITERDDIFIYETPINGIDDPNLLCLPVYNRELRRTQYTSVGTHSYVHHYLFGMPLIIPIPRDSATYPDLYRICIYFMQRYIDKDCIVNSSKNLLPLDSQKICHVPETFNVSEYPSDLFKLKLDSAYGSAEMGVLKNDGKVLVLSNRAVIALEWNSKYRSLYNETKLRDFTSKVYQRPIDLTLCIRSYLSATILPETQLIECTNCSQKKQVSERKELWVLPDCLIFHLKRVEDKDRICTRVNYPFELDMNKFSHTKGSSSTQYYLYAICNHNGSKEGGHYSASVKHTDGEWYCLYDSSVMRYLYPQAVLSNSACILFYKRRS